MLFSCGCRLVIQSPCVRSQISLLKGFLFAVVTFGYFDKTKYQPEAVRTNYKVAPEFRLYSALFGCWLIPIGLFVSSPSIKTSTLASIYLPATLIHII